MNTSEQATEAPSNQFNNAFTNPTNHHLVAQFLDNLIVNKVGSALKALEEKKIILVSREDFEQMKEIMKQKDLAINQWDESYTELEKAYDQELALRQSLEEDLLVFFMTMKQSANLFVSTKPIHDFSKELSRDAITQGIDLNNKAQFLLFMGKKMARMYNLITDKELQKNLKEGVDKIDFRGPLEVMVKYGVVKEDFLLNFKEKKALPSG